MELKVAGCSSSQLRGAGCTAADLRAVSFSLHALISAGYSTRELLEAAFAPQQLLEAQLKMEDIVSALPLAHYVAHNGYCYRFTIFSRNYAQHDDRFRTLKDGWPPISWSIGDDGHECGASARTQLGDWTPMPPGFEVAPDDHDAREMCRAYAWSTQALVLANGDAVWTGYWGHHTTSKAGVMRNCIGDI